ncbi:MAG: formylglycine-generating enzyme family protein [Planctomycetota bacterium]|nr:formylglycine-generating enzyme family protein [Planctomycetota bacterium]MDA1213294.1 formylglycine-generating enzyme family protein [Planctomycetota bacterium]
MTDKLLKLFMSEFVELQPGKDDFPIEFTMGNDDGPSEERPAHKVTLKHSFAIAKYEVPQNLYEAVLGINPSKWKGPRNSAEMMTWSDANEFCEMITQMLRDRNLLTDDEEIRLPTESEWEYACRAGTNSIYSFGNTATKADDENNQASILDEYAWHTGNAAGNDPPVGALKPNAWDLYDMHGYLWEFVTDDWHPNFDDAPIDGGAWISENDTTAQKQNAQLVIRGGSWKNRYDRLTSSSRKAISVDETGDDIGFRCVKSVIRRVP